MGLFGRAPFLPIPGGSSNLAGGPSGAHIEELLHTAEELEAQRTG